MSTLIWVGKAEPIAQVNTVTPANVNIGNTFTITINGKNVTVTATVATVANVTGLLTTAFNNSTIPEFAEITALDSTTHVTLTIDTAGVPFTQTSSAAGGTATNVTATTTAASGPNFANVAANWDTGAVPVSSDIVYLDNSDIDILYGLSMSGVTLASLTITDTYTGQIGLRKNNSNGYTEYRSDYWAISATSLIMRSPSSRVKINVGTVQTAIEVFATGLPDEAGMRSFLWKGTHASNTLEVSSGYVGAAFHIGETTTILTTQVSGGSVRLGSGCTLTTVNQSGGTLGVNSAVTTMTQSDGNLYYTSSGTIGTATINGTLHYNGSGTVTTLTINGVVTCNGDISSRTFTTTTLNKGGTIFDKARTITYTNKIALGNTVESVSAA